MQLKDQVEKERESKKSQISRIESSGSEQAPALVLLELLDRLDLASKERHFLGN